MSKDGQEGKNSGVAKVGNADPDGVSSSALWKEAGGDVVIYECQLDGAKAGHRSTSFEIGEECRRLVT